MKKKIYTILLGVFIIATITSAFIPTNNDVVDMGRNNTHEKAVMQNHPEAGYIEEIGY